MVILSVQGHSQGGALPSPATVFSGDISRMAYLDPAQRYVQYVLDNMNNVYTVIGNYKVMGTPYLFGGMHAGTVFSKSTKGSFPSFMYNTYHQQLELVDEKSKESPFKIMIQDIDSFFIDFPNVDSSVTRLKFINSTNYGFSSAFILQVIVDSRSRYSLFKKYSSVLGVVTTNIMQSNLKQFDLEYEYYYNDSQSHEIKKLKPNAASIIKELKLKGKAKELIENDYFTTNPETVLKDVFAEMNKTK